MQKLFKTLKKTCSYIRLDDVNELPALNIEERWCAIIVAEMAFSNSRQNLVADWIFAAGCRWMAAWGIDCSTWDDALDWAEISAWPEGAPDTLTMMTTWHENETLEEVFWFIGGQVETYDDLPFTHFVIIHLSDTDKELEMKKLFVSSLSG